MTNVALSNTTGVWIGTTTPYLCVSTGVGLTPAAWPAVWSATLIDTRTQALAVQQSFTAPRQRPTRSTRWGWLVGSGSQGQARPYGYHGTHGKHPGYGPTGFRRLERAIARLRA